MLWKFFEFQEQLMIGAFLNKNNQSWENWTNN